MDQQQQRQRRLLSKFPTIFAGFAHVNRKEVTVVPQEEEEKRSYVSSHLCRKPFFSQWYVNGRHYKHEHIGGVDRFEIFLDLVIVGIIAQIAYATAQDPSGAAGARFILVFRLVWSMWAEYRDYVNASGADDLVQRLYLIVTISLLLGMTVNAVGIPLHTSDDNEQQGIASIHATLGFYLVAKLIRIIIHLIYAVCLPQFWLDQVSNAIFKACDSIFFMAALLRPTTINVVTLTAIGIFLELSSPFILLWLRMALMKCLPSGERSRMAFVTVNPSHYIRRNAVFVSLVLGEAVTEVFYNAAQLPQGYGLSAYYGRAFMALYVIFGLHWLYFHDKYDDLKYHPMLQTHIRPYLFVHFQWPLCAAIILASSAIAPLVQEISSDEGLRWYWGIGTALALAYITIIRSLYPLEAELPEYCREDRRESTDDAEKSSSHNDSPADSTTPPTPPIPPLRKTFLQRVLWRLPGLVFNSLMVALFGLMPLTLPEIVDNTFFLGTYLFGMSLLVVAAQIEGWAFGKMYR